MVEVESELRKTHAGFILHRTDAVKIGWLCEIIHELQLSQVMCSVDLHLPLKEELRLQPKLRHRADGGAGVSTSPLYKLRDATNDPAQFAAPSCPAQLTPLGFCKLMSAGSEPHWWLLCHIPSVRKGSSRGMCRN